MGPRLTSFADYSRGIFNLVHIYSTVGLVSSTGAATDLDLNTSENSVTITGSLNIQERRRGVKVCFSTFGRLPTGIKEHYNAQVSSPVSKIGERY